MHLDTLREYIRHYAHEFSKSPFLCLWETQQLFQTFWDQAAIDFGAMFNRALDSQVNRRLWSAHAYQPKEVILHFIRWEPDQVRAMFRDLYDESKDLDSRIQRFRFMAGDMLAGWHGENKKPFLPAHDQDLAVISLYLAMKYPGQYAPYHHHLFLSGLKALRVSVLPVVEEPLRWFVIARTVHKFLMQDTELIKTYATSMRDPRYYQGETLLLSFDFFRFVAERNGVAT